GVAASLQYRYLDGGAEAPDTHHRPHSPGLARCADRPPRRQRLCREHLMRWCEANGVDYLFGMAKNQRLLRILGGEMQQAKELFAQTQQPARVFKDFTYRTHQSWSRARRVVGKAEYLAKGENPRFVVTSLTATAFPDRVLYEQEYCGRGDMENRIKEQQLFLFAYRTSCATMSANQVRLLLSAVAYIVLRALRQFGLTGTELATAQCDTSGTRSSPAPPTRPDHGPTCSSCYRAPKVSAGGAPSPWPLTATCM